LKKFNSRTSRFTGKTALITGASSGIGAATARRLATQGLKVILVARRAEKLEQLAEEIRASGGEAKIYVVDLSNDENINQLTLRLNQEGWMPDVLVNNAGFGWYGYFTGMAEETAVEMVQVNIRAAVLLTRRLLPHMQTNRFGAIINVGSIAGSMPNQGIALYSASKAFLDAFSTSLHREMRGSGVQVSVVRPGPVKTEFFQTARELPGGGTVPAERFSVSAERVADSIAELLEHPRRVDYVPRILVLSAWLEPLFGWLIDRIGPLLLRRRKIIKPLV
jgi:uncharacterized protein